MNHFDVIIIGAGAAGLMCAIEAGKRNKRVLVIDHANKPGKKILMSGGGKCNFTNYNVHPDCYISHNRHFCKSALSQYTQWDFIELVKKHKIPFHEKTLGQLFCDNKSKDIVNMLLTECNEFQIKINLNESVEKIEKKDTFEVFTNKNKLTCTSLVIASGGLSIPTMGASPFGYKIAEQFGLKVWPTKAGLVPFTLHKQDKENYSLLSGVSFHSTVLNQRASFTENSLFTHRGLSGPAMLQISSYWNPGESITINLLPEHNILEIINKGKENKKQFKSILANYLSKRLIEKIIDKDLLEKKCNAFSKKELQLLESTIHNWPIQPNGTEGYRTAEVTLGGVDCNEISSKTMESLKHKGLFFIGEVLDVTGWLGGYNFQWAWSSGFVAGKFV